MIPLTQRPVELAPAHAYEILIRHKTITFLTLQVAHLNFMGKSIAQHIQSRPDRPNFGPQPANFDRF
jgi:hypothetical protein